MHLGVSCYLWLFEVALFFSPSLSPIIYNAYCIQNLLYTIPAIIYNMPKARCERCGGKAKALYVRDVERVQHSFDPNDRKVRQRWRRVGYLCSACGFVKIEGVKADVVKDVVNVVKAGDREKTPSLISRLFGKLKRR